MYCKMFCYEQGPICIEEVPKWVYASWVCKPLILSTENKFFFRLVFSSMDKPGFRFPELGPLAIFDLFSVKY